MTRFLPEFLMLLTLLSAAGLLRAEDKNLLRNGDFGIATNVGGKRRPAFWTTNLKGDFRVVKTDGGRYAVRFTLDPQKRGNLIQWNVPLTPGRGRSADQTRAPLRTQLRRPRRRRSQVHRQSERDVVPPRPRRSGRTSLFDHRQLAGLVQVLAA